MQDQSTPDTEPPELPYDDRQDHEPCPKCNPDGKGVRPGWLQHFQGPDTLCDHCEGAGWV